MTKLSFEALKQRAEAIASEDLLMTISGGTENACHVELTGILEVDVKLIDKHLDKIKNQPQ